MAHKRMNGTNMALCHTWSHIPSPHVLAIIKFLVSDTSTSHSLLPRHLVCLWSYFYQWISALHVEKRTCLYHESAPLLLSIVWKLSITCEHVDVYVHHYDTHQCLWPFDLFLSEAPTSFVFFSMIFCCLLTESKRWTTVERGREREWGEREREREREKGMMLTVQKNANFGIKWINRVIFH